MASGPHPTSCGWHSARPGASAKCRYFAQPANTPGGSQRCFPPGQRSPPWGRERRAPPRARTGVGQLVSPRCPPRWERGVRQPRGRARCLPLPAACELRALATSRAEVATAAALLSAGAGRRVWATRCRHCPRTRTCGQRGRRRGAPTHERTSSTVPKRQAPGHALPGDSTRHCPTGALTTARSPRRPSPRHGAGPERAVRGGEP